MPTAIVSVTNDLTTDQRVDRTCMALVKSGYDVLLVGRRLRNSVTLKSRPYRMHRMRLLFDTGPLFYAEYNITLFFFLLMHRYDLIVSNDLDTLAANYVAEKLKHPFPGRRHETRKVRHIHDCHEYFRGVPELNGRKTVTNVWKWIEDRIFPNLEHVIAVNQSVARLYSDDYGNNIEVVRNVPFRKPLTGACDKTSLQIRAGCKIIMYQGAVNVDRGIEEAILAMKHVRSDAVLVIAGIGDLYDSLRKYTEEQGLTGKVIFLGQVPFQDLHAYTLSADLGLSIEKDVSINYHYCLPNKFLDYIQAGVPVLVSPFPEMKAITDHYQIGEFVKSHDPELLAAQFDSMLNNAEQTSVWKQNLRKAAQELCWELEEKKLIDLVTRNP